jgi:hypothetical protein
MVGSKLGVHGRDGHYGMANVQNRCPANANACECVQAGIDCEFLEHWQTLLW